MTAIHAADGAYVQIASEALQDNRLSLRARGLLAYLLAASPGTTINLEQITAQVQEGREAVRTAIRELLEHGYARRERVQDERGHWQVTTAVSDTAAFAGEVQGNS